MKWKWTVVLGLFLLAGMAFAQDKAENKSKKTNTSTNQKAVVKRVSYGIGFDQGKRFLDRGIELDAESMFQGFRDAFAKKKGLYSDKELNEAYAVFDKILKAKQAEKAGAAGKKGRDFLAANKKKKGVVTLKSGLQYLVIKQGTGRMPKAKDRVKTHYHGMLIDGTVFDSSVQRKMPFSFRLLVDSVIKGWTEALPLMKVGSKWKLFIPSELAYGKRGSPPKIASDSVLIFEIELLSIEK
jgi:FKBP-type peptidyl-prolyl cis-trans isomerase FklB